ncbi:hypothetical protein ISF_05111 [Cordyceps fumosorosea ARSEF 2679]|uniref:Uncharacterized protein n=1 Tax=Cordyceps fumosorosea (strain ARSEF 2679) TaxID=1081104 RepID=A0A167V0S9_CORFA|nr:hypothetical protein ISF_05111 [Cordyceps fumosorosea ARSEF 2679]OAA62102.1 hypothetical protein ISF_05111 [Cordyceps fumosorosea ARSEF 2679]
MSSRRRKISVEDSWRMVDGENDSFDTSLIPGATPNEDEDDILIPLSSEQPSSGFPSQPPPSSQSQPNSSFDSQDSLHSFVKHRADSNVIMRQPFNPSIPPSMAASSRDSSRLVQGPRTPDPQFRMPTVEVISRDRRSSGQSSRTTRPSAVSGSSRGDDSTAVKRRGHITQSSPVKRRSTRHRPEHDHDDAYKRDRDDYGPPLPSISVGIAQWAAAVVGLAFNYAKRPLALLLAVYLSCGAIIVTQNMLQKSVYISLSPICRVPGASLLSLPFCPSPGSQVDSDAPDGRKDPVEFNDLMGVQSKFEDVLERSAEGVSLPLEMKRSETSLRDLRTLVKRSDIEARDELLFELDGFIDTARHSATDLQRFNTHVGSAVDAVIIINRWTVRYIDSLAPLEGGGPSTSSLAIWPGWLFSPFQPGDHIFSEHVLRDKYIEHTMLVSERIAALILEAQAVLRLLTRAEDHLSLIYDVSSRSTEALESRRDEILSKLWTIVGGNAGRLDHLRGQLNLLRRVDEHRTSAVNQVTALVLELEAIQAGLGDLRDRVAEPAVLRDAGSPAASLPLTIHIETINSGVERLEAARRRIRAAEDGRVQDALAKGGVRDDQGRLIGDTSS